jgi:hypothetical protein
MGFLAGAILALAVALTASASRAAGIASETDCLLACASQYNACIAAQVTTQGACMVQNEACQKACKGKKN